MIATPEPLEVAESVPHVAPLHPVPESAHVTPALAESLVTVAVNGWAAPVGTVAAAGATLTEIAPVLAALNAAVKPDQVPAGEVVQLGVNVPAEVFKS